MLTKTDKTTIISLAKEFKVKELYLFGSSLEDTENAADIDLAVRGIASELFFDFQGKLLRLVSKPVDVVNLARQTRFTRHIEKKAVKIYGWLAYQVLFDRRVKPVYIWESECKVEILHSSVLTLRY